MDLITAVKNNDLNKVRTCLQRKVNLEYDDGIWTPLMHAIEQENVEIISSLLDHGADIKFRTIDSSRPLHLAVDINNIDIVTMLLQHNADPNVCNIRSWTPLFYAKSPKMAELLLQYNAKIDHRDLEGNSILHYSAQYKSPKMLRFLSKYIDLNDKNKKGEIPLHLASRANNIENAQVLLSLGCDFEIKDNEGRFAKEVTLYEAMFNLIDSYEFPVKCAED